MKFAKYVLSGVCLSVINSGNVWAQYAGEDPELVQLKEQIKKLEGQINEMRETDKQLDVRAQGIEEKLKVQKDEFLETRDSLKTEIDKAKKSSETVLGLQEKVEQLEGAQASSNEKIEALKTNVNSQPNGEEETNKKDIEELTQAVLKLNEKWEEQKELNEQQNLEAAKNKAEIDKLKKKDNMSSKLSSVGGFLGNLAKGGMELLSSKLSDGNSGSTSEVYASVFKNGMNLIAQHLSPKSIKEKLVNGKPNAEIMKEMNEVEKSDFHDIVQDIQTGKNEKEIQEKLDNLKEKIATRKTEEVISEVEKSKFQKYAFYGLNVAFNSVNLSETVTKFYELSEGASEAPKAEIVLSGNVSSTDQDAVNAIYDMVSKGATLNDIFDCISFHTEGVPMQVERKDAPKDSMVNTLLSMAVTEAEQKNKDSDAKNSEEGVVADGMQPGVAQGSVVNANGEVVDEAGQVASVEGTTAGMDEVTGQGAGAEELQPGELGEGNAEKLGEQNFVINDKGEVVAKPGQESASVEGTTAGMDEVTGQGAGAEELHPGELGEGNAEELGEQNFVINDKGEVVAKPGQALESVEGTTAGMDEVTGQGAGAEELQPGELGEVNAEELGEQNSIINDKGGVVAKPGQALESVEGTTAGMDEVTGQGASAEELQPGELGEVNAEELGEQNFVINDKGEVVAKPGQESASVDGTTAGMDEVTEQGAASNKTTNATPIAINYKEVVPSSYLRDPMSVSEKQKPVAKNGAESPVVQVSMR